VKTGAYRACDREVCVVNEKTVMIGGKKHLNFISLAHVRMAAVMSALCTSERICNAAQFCLIRMH